MLATVVTNRDAHRTSRPATIAAGVYVGAWVVGLTAFGSGVASDATAADIAAHHADHRVASALQSVLVHGVAAAALAAVLATAVRTAGLPKASHLAGVVGVGLSAVQLVLGLWRSLVASGTGVVTLVDIIDRVDGAKILAFAVMVGVAVPALRRVGRAGSRMTAVGHATTATLGVAGVAYLLDVEPLLWTAAPALVLLLVWVSAFAVAADRRRR